LKGLLTLGLYRTFFLEFHPESKSKSLATASSALQSQDPMVKKRIDDAVALFFFYVECSIGVHL